MTYDEYIRFLEFDIQRKEYLNQTFNFLPGYLPKYHNLTKFNWFEDVQELVTNQDEVEKSVKYSVDYMIHLLRYASGLREMIQDIADETLQLISDDIKAIDFENSVPLIVTILTLIFIPICVIFTLNITNSMMRYANVYDEKANNLKIEKANSDKLLSALLPPSIIYQMKRGKISNNLIANV